MNQKIYKLPVLLSILMLAMVAPTAFGQQITQTIILNPGWNAVWLEATPANTSPAAVFAGLPVQSVWTWASRVNGTDFVQNPNSTGWNKNQWLVWLPPGNPAAPTLNLYAILPGRAYLVKIGGAVPVTWQVTGTVIRQPVTWSPGQYNLRGFSVDSIAPATFRNYFKYSPAHWDSANDTTTPIYRLDATGVWTRVSADDAMQRGLAYWVFVNGASAYDAPESMTATTGDGIFFSPLAMRTTMTLVNNSDVARTIRFSSLSPSVDGFLVQNLMAQNPADATAPMNGYVITLAAGEHAPMRLLLNRSAQPSGPNQTVFSVKDGAGSLQYIGVGSDGAGGLESTDGATNSFALQGLWIGTVTVSAVAEAQSANPALTTPVNSPFTMRILMHADSNGVCNLLKEVTVAQLPLVYTNAVTNFTVPGAVVLLTDPTVVNLYRAKYANNANVTVRRYTAVQFDDAAHVGGSPMVGSFITNGSLSVTLSIPSGYATNPYYHRYHPDHDNLDPTYTHYVQEDFAISRSVELNFTPAGTGVPSFGMDGIDGIYKETITGLHKIPLQVSGTFFLQRISDVGALNPPL